MIFRFELSLLTSLLALGGAGCSLADNSDLGSGSGSASPDGGGQGGSSGGGAGGALSSGGSSGAGGAGGSSGAGGTGGSAGADLAVGSSCNTSAECNSSFCVDGVCCTSACTGLCEACSAAAKGGGDDGACAPVQAGVDPDADCSDQGPSSCGTVGVCNGLGACELYGPTTQCSGGTCSAGVRTLPGTCGGAGSCVPGSTESCAPAVCDGDVCEGQCAGDEACPASDYCDLVSGACTPKLADGAACQSDQAARCQSGNCVEGVCCNSACGGVCEGCASGICSPHSGGVDPDGDCSVESAASCGRDGFCDGAGACSLYADGVHCAPRACISTASAADSSCDGNGSCQQGSPIDCGAYACSGSACRTSCSTGAHCSTGNTCVNGLCGTSLPNGSNCGGGVECQSDFCVDNVCCATACTGSCQSCSAADQGPGGVNGVCGNATAGLDPHDDCATDPVSSCDRTGGCDGSGGCALYGDGTECAPLVCSNGTILPASRCDGAGLCMAGLSGNSCAPYTCRDLTGCHTACSSDAHCSSGNFCKLGDSKCVPPQGNGAVCSSPGQCASGFCVDDRCCNTDCSGECRVCTVGICKTVACGQPNENGCFGGERCISGSCSPVVGCP